MRWIVIGLVVAVLAACVLGCKATRTETEPAKVGLKHVKMKVYPDGTVERDERSSNAKGDAIKTGDPLKKASNAVVKASQTQASAGEGGEQSASAGGGETEFTVPKKATYVYLGCLLVLVGGGVLCRWDMKLGLMICATAVIGAGTFRFFDAYPWAMAPLILAGVGVAGYAVWRLIRTQQDLTTSQTTEKAVVTAIEQAPEDAANVVKALVEPAAGGDADRKVVKDRIAAVKAQPGVQAAVAGAKIVRAGVAA